MERQKRKTVITNTPYDDVFRTLLNDCSSLVIPVINEIFGENYTGEEQVVFAPNEHFMNRQGGEEVKRITDSSFKIIGEGEKEYLYECQSTADSSMLVRVFEYATQIALDHGEITGETLRVRIPHSAVLFLRSSRKIPDKMRIEIETPGGCVGFDVPVMKLISYGIEEIFARNLLFLIPFYIFTHESRFEEYEKDERKLEALKEEYGEIARKLEEKAKTGRISAYTKKTIMEMSGKVIGNIAEKYEKIREGVGTVMGGKILEYEAKDILREGIKEGRKEGIKEGRKEGRSEGIIETLIKLVADGVLSTSDAAARANMTEEAFKEKSLTV